MGYTMVRFRQNLFLKKLATTPLRRSTFVGAQIASRSVLVLVQVSLLVVVAVVLFHLPMSLPAAAWTALIAVLGLITFMGVGFVLACLVEAEGVVNDIINSLITPLVLFSEIFFP